MDIFNNQEECSGLSQEQTNDFFARNIKGELDGALDFSTEAYFLD